MFVLNVLYPNKEGAQFDRNYYEVVHLKLLEDHLGELMEYYTVDYGISGFPPTTPTPFNCVARIFFPSSDLLTKALGKIGPVAADIVNYTNVEPTLFISELLD